MAEYEDFRSIEETEKKLENEFQSFQLGKLGVFGERKETQDIVERMEKVRQDQVSIAKYQIEAESAFPRLGVDGTKDDSFPAHHFSDVKMDIGRMEEHIQVLSERVDILLKDFTEIKPE
ncbi:hypothetical protein ADUPG1_011870 [Aduncisulcus paluster]|uniref:Uncharacterized protein n=1 Tax=Aduncisulcus paluster TaxID=2918883 RepID=A0ABQ5JXK3_9EUKA|nr:hypothetical protein ADUPG1_011870 [Aduncisulcus paluster]